MDIVSIAAFALAWASGFLTGWGYGEKHPKPSKESEEARLFFNAHLGMYPEQIRNKYDDYVEVGRRTPGDGSHWKDLKVEFPDAGESEPE